MSVLIRPASLGYGSVTSAFVQRHVKRVALPPYVRAELTERLIASLAEDISPEITSAQLAEVRRRLAQVETGGAALIPGYEVLARVRNLLAEHLPSR